MLCLHGKKENTRRDTMWAYVLLQQMCPDKKEYLFKDISFINIQSYLVCNVIIFQSVWLYMRYT